MSYKMPKVSVGPCVWHPSLDSAPVPALITQVGNRAVNLTVFAPDNRGGIPKDGVRHISDPDLKTTPEAIGAGCWDYTADQKALASLVEALNPGSKK